MPSITVIIGLVKDTKHVGVVSDVAIKKKSIKKCRLSKIEERDSLVSHKVPSQVPV